MNFQPLTLNEVLFNIDADTMEAVYSSMFEAGAIDQAREFRRLWEEIWTPELLESLAAGKEIDALIGGMR